MVVGKYQTNENHSLQIRTQIAQKKVFEEATRSHKQKQKKSVCYMSYTDFMLLFVYQTYFTSSKSASWMFSSLPPLSWEPAFCWPPVY